VSGVVEAGSIVRKVIEAYGKPMGGRAWQYKFVIPATH
jgi:hypothetical protein